MKKLALSILSVALFGTSLSYAQDRMESIVVTGTRIDSDVNSVLFREMPNVRLRVPADFVLFEASFVNGDLDLNRRKQDLETTYNRVLASDRAREDIELTIGDAEESFPVDSVTFDEAYSSYGQRGSFSLAMRVDAKPGETYDEVRERAEAFLKEIDEVGRVQYFVDDEQYIGLRNPERFRPTLITAISEDVNKMADAFTASEITVLGLEEKTITQPTGALSLDVYIPYSLTIVSKR